MISVSDATEIVCREASPLGTQTVQLADAVGRTLAEQIVADSDMPPFDRSQMDGFAVRADDTIAAPVRLRVVGESAAGRGWHQTLEHGETVSIMTGASVPDGADAIQKIELCQELTGSTLIAEPGTYIEIIEPTENGRYIVKKGSEIRNGEIVFEPGGLVTEAMIAPLAAFGYAEIKVGNQPRITILGTGSEIVNIEDRPGKDQIRNSNSVTLAAMSRRCGAIAVVAPNVKDDLSELMSAIKEAAAASDVVIITGGVSVGKYDLTKIAIADLGAKIYFEKVRLKPGKPTVFGRLNDSLIFGLPGNPVSAAVTFHLFVRAALAVLQGRADPSPKVGFAILSGNVRAAGQRTTYLPARLSSLNSGHLSAEPLRWHGSSDFIGYSRADALVVLEQGTSHSIGECVPIEYL